MGVSKSTKKQHYIPRMILKNFVFFRVPMRMPMIYQYDKFSHTERLVDIRDVCRKHYLYELRDENNRIVEKNLIEKSFSDLERKWDVVIKKVLMNSDLDETDEALLRLLIVLQLIRTPEVIEFTSDWLYDTCKSCSFPLERYVADGYAKLASFVCGGINSDVNWILHMVFQLVSDGKYLVVYRSDKPFILNDNRPVLCIPSCNGTNSYNHFLPIAKNCCLGLVDNKTKRYVHMTDSMTDDINSAMYHNESRFIYSSTSLIHDMKFE